MLIDIKSDTLTESRTRDAGFKVLSANHYTIRARYTNPLSHIVQKRAASFSVTFSSNISSFCFTYSWASLINSPMTLLVFYSSALKSLSSCNWSLSNEAYNSWIS